MWYFAALLPSPDFIKAVHHFRAQHSPAPEKLVPHVTIKIPFESALSPEALGERLSGMPRHPQPMTLEAVSSFPQAKVVILKVIGPHLVALHRAVLAGIGEPAGSFEGDTWHPHLTLLHTRTDLDPLVEAARKAFTLPLPQTPTGVVLLRTPVRGQAWQICHEISFDALG